MAKKAALAAVVPATANIIGKLANGIVDDTVTMMLSVFQGPILVFPAVHPVTMSKKSVRRNLATLAEDGFEVIRPVEGYSISEKGRLPMPGAMPQPEVVAAHIERRVRFGA
jgi:phosphopantothenoylcysteine decarboxylase/phosphopantothenate--cysteine ligase